MSTLRYVCIGLLCLVGTTVEAAGTIGDAAENLHAITGGVRTLMELASFVIGSALTIGAVMLYRQHRASPKLVPLTTPFILFVLGLGTLTFLYYTSEGFRNIGQDSGALDGMIRAPQPVPVEQPVTDTTAPQAYHPDTHQTPKEDKYW